MANYPSFSEGVTSKSAVGVAREATPRTYVSPTSYSPFTSLTLAEDPGVYSPATMQGVISTDVYVMQGEAKGNGAYQGPLFSTNAILPFIGSIGSDNGAGYGVTSYQAPLIASAGSPGSAGSSTSFAATGVMSITATGISGTFAVGQVLLISGSTDTANGWEVVQITAFTTPTITCTATTKIHTGTISIKTVGAKSSGSVSAGGSTISLASGLGALFTTGDIVQIDVNSGTSTSSEIHAISVSTDTLTITDSSPDNNLYFAHANGVSVFRLGDATHVVLVRHRIPSGALNSFSLEQNIAGVESLKWAGCKFGKGSLSCPSGNNPASLNLDISAMAEPVVLASPTAPSTTTESPFQFAEGALSIFGSVHPEVYNVKMDWDNVLKATYTQAQSHWPSFLTKTNFHVTGSFDAVFHNFDDATDGFWSKMDAVTTGALSYTLQHADGSSIIVNMPKIAITKLPITAKPADIAYQSLSYMAFYDVANAAANLSVDVINSIYHPY